MKPLVSVIIVDYKDDNPYLKESFGALSKQTYSNYEIILVTDYQNKLTHPKLTKKHYGKYVGPAEKRDDGAKLAKGTILSFLDDDAYPSPNWLEEVVKEFEDKDVIAVGGPGITPPGVSWQEEASGWASASPLGSGQYLYRFIPHNRQYVDDFPSMNLSVRRKEFLSIGGFDSNYWPGEDTKLCLDLVYKLNKKIIYNPDAQVYHHRRPILFKHLRQNGNFGLHRGFFARVLPATSFKPIYFLPSLMLLGLIYLVASTILPVLGLGVLINKQFLVIVEKSFTIYFTLLFLNATWVLLVSKKLSQGLLSFPIIFITHLWYGIRFLQGLLFTDKLRQ